MNLAFASLRFMGLLPDIACMGVVVFALAFIGWLGLPETWGRDVDFNER
jgi:hypothetical protein